MTSSRTGLCPGCNAWSLEAPPDEDLDVIERILEDHAAECPWLEALAVIQREQMIDEQ